ncbi:MAG: hypothetical protein ACI8Y4_002251 [Candidatus Poriferisodalaceae bacterium]|jgi:hypothetical protein
MAMGDPAVVNLLETMGELFAHVRFDAGWSIGEALHVIGCRSERGELTVAHLETAVRQMRRLAVGVHELAEVIDEHAVIDLAFREPAGAEDGLLRSMADERWPYIYADAHAYVADNAFGPEIVKAPSNVRSLLRDLKSEAV